MKVIIDIPEEVLKYPYDYCCNTLVNQIKENYTPIPNNATNGDVIKAMFPNMKAKEKAFAIEVTVNKNKVGNISEDWWNAPYKAESEE